MLSCICCFACPVKTKYSRLLEQRQYQKKSIAERRRERDEAEKERLQQLDEKRKLAAEFYERGTIKRQTEPVDLKSMGYKSGADFGPLSDTVASLPENTEVLSQRISASTSMMGMKVEESKLTTKLIGNKESACLASESKF